MRQLVASIVILTACGSKAGNSTGDGGPGDGGPTTDAVPIGTPLVDRIAVATIATPSGVMAAGSTWRIWGQGDLGIAPVFTVPYADCGTLVGYTTGAGTPDARVARLDPTDRLTTTYDLGAYVLRGLAAEPDGHFAALLWDQTVSPAQLHVTRFDATGAPGWSTSLADALAAPTDFGIGESRLEYGGGQYSAYFHVHGISGFANGHEGDALHALDAISGADAIGWEWGCSHSMSELLRYDAAAAATLPICVTDCYPGTTGGNFATDSIGGVYLSNSSKVLDVDGGCDGSVAGELGGAAPGPAGWKLVFNAHQAPATNGQSSYSTSTMNQDVGFASITSTATPGAVVWLTTTSGDEANSSIARWRPSGDPAEQYVVGWSASGAYQLGRISDAGAFLEGPVDISAKARWGERDDPFRDHGNGDVVWSWFDAAGATSFHFARVKSGGTAQCAAL